MWGISLPRKQTSWLQTGNAMTTGCFYSCKSPWLLFSREQRGAQPFSAAHDFSRCYSLLAPKSPFVPDQCQSQNGPVQNKSALVCYVSKGTHQEVFHDDPHLWGPSRAHSHPVFSPWTVNAMLAATLVTCGGCQARRPEDSWRFGQVFQYRLGELTKSHRKKQRSSSLPISWG